MKDYFIEKYEGYIRNLEWHLETNGEYVTELERKVIEARINAYREILTDLKML